MGGVVCLRLSGSAGAPAQRPAWPAGALGHTSAAGHTAAKPGPLRRRAGSTGASGSRPGRSGSTLRVHARLVHAGVAKCPVPVGAWNPWRNDLHRPRGGYLLGFCLLWCIELQNALFLCEF